MSYLALMKHSSLIAKVCGDNNTDCSVSKNLAIVIRTFEGQSLNVTYLIGHNNPINGFRPAATRPSRRLCFLRAYARWLHQSMTGLP